MQRVFVDAAGGMVRYSMDGMWVATYPSGTYVVYGLVAMPTSTHSSQTPQCETAAKMNYVTSMHAKGMHIVEACPVSCYTASAGGT